MTTAASKLLPRILGVVGAGQMGAGIAQASGEFEHAIRWRRRPSSASTPSHLSSPTQPCFLYLLARSFLPPSLSPVSLPPSLPLSLFPTKTKRGFLTRSPSPLSLSPSLPLSLPPSFQPKTKPKKNPNQSTPQVASTKGLSVTLVDPDPRALQRGLTNIGRSLDRLVKREALSRGEADAALERVRGAASLEALSEAELVVEAVSEDERLKKSIFATLDRVAPPAAILASNTSSISITRIAAATQRPGNVVGMHFMNPVPLMPLVELVRGIATTDETFSTATRLAELLGKTVTHSADRPGFTVNRILMPSINEAFFCLMEGVASAEDIDRGMKLGTNQPLGPLALADFIGLDTCLSILKVMAETDPRFIPCVLLQQYVDAGWTGKKAFRGV